MKPVWCFAVRNSSQLIGVVSVGSFDSEDDRHRQGGTPWGSALDVSPHGSTPPTRARSRAMELAVSQFWMTLAEVCRGRRASVTDPVSRLLTREAFLDEAQMAAEGCYARGEPVAVAVIAVEGLRGLMDEGQWELANEVIAEVCRSLKARVRPDDLLGRFDDSRFCVLLRRVDSELASLIVTQLADRLSELSGTELFPSDDVCIRCGVAGSGHKSPQVGELLSGAVRICHRARMQEVRVAMDVDVVSARVAHAEEGDIETT